MRRVGKIWVPEQFDRLDSDDFTAAYILHINETHRTVYNYCSGSRVSADDLWCIREQLIAVSWGVA